MRRSSPITIGPSSNGEDGIVSTEDGIVSTEDRLFVIEWDIICE